MGEEIVLQEEESDEAQGQVGKARDKPSAADKGTDLGATPTRRRTRRNQISPSMR
jgi:hypothetical protein